MEDPGSWNLLTATLAVCNLKEPRSAWVILVDQGLVQDDPGNQEEFIRIVQKELGKIITGPSSEMRITNDLDRAAIVMLIARMSDPWGVKALQRLETSAAQNGNKDLAQKYRSMRERVEMEDGPWRERYLKGEREIFQRRLRIKSKHRQRWWKFW